MRSFILSIFLVLVSVSVLWAAPFLVCDEYPSSGVMPDWFNIKINGAAPIQSPAEALANGNRRLHYDVGSYAPGTYHLDVSAVKDYGAEGVAESAYVPFDYVKPAKTSPSQPAHIKLEP